MKKNLLYFISTLLLLVNIWSNNSVFAQGGGPPCWPPEACIPINNGIWILLLAGLVFGGIKIYTVRKSSKD